MKRPLKTMAEWWELAYEQFGHKPGVGLVGLEQAYFQSKREKVCAECLSPDLLVLQTGRHLIKATDFYLCQACLDWYAAKYARDEALASQPS